MKAKEEGRETEQWKRELYYVFVVVFSFGTAAPLLPFVEREALVPPRASVLLLFSFAK